MTVASGNGVFVADVGRKIPDAVFYSLTEDGVNSDGMRLPTINTYGVSLEPLNQYTVQ